MIYFVYLNFYFEYDGKTIDIFKSNIEHTVVNRYYNGKYYYDTKKCMTYNNLTPNQFHEICRDYAFNDNL